ncbi:MAG: hypothetical protein FWC70_05085 [Defluviitaleaceae bacterium]|nr:hypothetical protein [Defluviitaleaceae bacterium]
MKKFFAVTAAAAMLLFLFAGCGIFTSWTVLVAREDISTISQMQTVLDDAGIRSQVIDNGRGLRVDSRRAGDARTLLSTSGILADVEHFTWEDTPLANRGLSGGGSRDEARLRHTHATEVLIEAQLVAIDGITEARVQLSIPHDMPFDLNPPLPSASVTLVTTEDFDPGDGRDLALLVMHNVPQLIIENIVIMNQDARLLWNAGIDATPASEAQ